MSSGCSRSAVYANAAVRAVGGDDMSGRIASVVVGALNVALVFLIAQLDDRARRGSGISPPLILMLTPAHWSFAQLGTDAIFPVPLVLLWLWNLLRFFKCDSMRHASPPQLRAGTERLLASRRRR